MTSKFLVSIIRFLESCASDCMEYCHVIYYILKFDFSDFGENLFHNCIGGSFTRNVATGSSVFRSNNTILIRTNLLTQATFIVHEELIFKHISEAKDTVFALFGNEMKHNIGNLVRGEGVELTSRYFGSS